MIFPSDINLHWISRDSDIDKLQELHNEKFIGIDSEWRPELTYKHKTQPALLQISGKKNSFLIDIKALSQNKKLDLILSKIFSSKEITIIGFGFQSDFYKFKTKLPQMKFIQYIENFFDIQDYIS